MDSVQWNASAVNGEVDALMPENLLEFVKDDELVNSFGGNDGIISPGPSPFLIEFAGI